MNLIEIEQLGGYYQAKNWLDKNEIHVVMHGYLEKYRAELLQYRREHGIFEVGDKVVSTLHGDEFWMEIVCTIDGFHKKMVITNGGGHVIHHYDFRHATDAEIKACKRLEVG